MPTQKRLVNYLVVNPGAHFSRFGLSARLGKITYDLMTRFLPSQERVAKRLWGAVKRRPTTNPFALFHFWHLINIGVIDFNRVDDLEAFCTLLNTYPTFRQIFVNLVLRDDEHDADIIRYEQAVRLPIHLRKGLDLLAVSTQKDESEAKAVKKIKDWLNDPVIMTRFVDRCAPWLVHLNVNILHSLLEKNHAAVRFLNPDSFGLNYAHSARVLQKRFESEDKVIELLTRNVDDVPEHLALRTEQYYFATAMKFAFEYQRPLIKQILRQVVVDYPQELPPHLQIIHNRLFGEEPNLYLADFLSGHKNEEDSHDDDHHHHHHHDHGHGHGHGYKDSETFVLFEILCGEKHSKTIAGQKFTERLTKALKIRGNPLAFVIELINLEAPHKNVINFIMKNITTLMPIIAKSLDSNGVIALNDLVTRTFRFEAESTTITEVYNEKFQQLLSQLSPDSKLSIRERADVYAEIRENLENNFISQLLVIDTRDIELLLNDPVYGKHFAPVVTRNLRQMQVSDVIDVEYDQGYLDAEARIAQSDSLQAYADSLSEDDLADAYLLASAHWEKISPRQRSGVNKFFNWLNKVFTGRFEARFEREEDQLAEIHPMFKARLAYEREGEQKPFNAFLVDYAKQHWVEELKKDDELSQLITSFVDGEQILELMNLTGSHSADENNAFKRAVNASPYLKSRLLDFCAIDDPENSLDILFFLMEDVELIKEYLQDDEFRALMAKILQHIEGFSLPFMLQIADLDVRLFVEMVDDRFEDFTGWFFHHYKTESLNLILRSGHKDFCVRVLRALNEINKGVIWNLVEKRSPEFIRACTEQPTLVRFILEQPQMLREVFYEETFYLVAAMYARGDGKVGFDLSEELIDEIRDIVLEKAVTLAELDAEDEDKDNGQIPILRNLLSSMFQHAPKEFFRDLQEDELFALYKHIQHPSAIFDDEFVATHRSVIVQMFCEHILDIDIDYWSVVFNREEDLERVFVYLNDAEQQAVVDRVRELPDKTLFKQLASLESPAIREFILSHKNAAVYDGLRHYREKLLRHESVSTEDLVNENESSCSSSNDV